jgi:hypothetical protein
MKKAELEAKILELEKKIAVLEARPQFCMGHSCCNHWNYPANPNQPWYTVTACPLVLFHQIQ